MYCLSSPVLFTGNHALTVIIHLFLNEKFLTSFYIRLKATNKHRNLLLEELFSVARVSMLLTRLRLVIILISTNSTYR